MSHAYTTFNPTPNNALLEPMFLGQGVNVARYDQQRYPVFEALIEKQLSFFWRPEEVDLSRDRIDYAQLPENEQHIFISNLKYQTLLDSIQGRSPNIALLPLVSLPELETWIENWANQETVHSRSYTHIIRNIVNDPSLVFDDIVVNEEILARAKDISHYYDDLIHYSQLYQTLGVGTHTINGKTVSVSLRELKKKLYLCLMCVNILEGIRFYVSFACSFCFAENRKMEGNAKIIRLICRDENLHLASTQKIINIWQSGNDDPDMADIAKELEPECVEMFGQACEQEKAWAKYLFSKGSMLGLNETMLHQYIEYLCNLRMKMVHLPEIYPQTQQNPLSWINAWISSEQVQVAPQEVELSSYLIGQTDNNLDSNAFNDMVL